MSADVAETVFYNEDSASPATVLKPAAFASGQRLTFTLAQDSGLLSDLVVPSGWLAVTGGTVDINSQRDKAYYHDWNALDPSSWDFAYNSGASVAGVLCRITGADLAVAPVCATSNTSSNTSTMTSPSVTPTGTDDVLITTYSNQGGAHTLAYTAPSGMTDLGSTQVAGGFQCIAAAKQQLVSGSATGTRTWTGLSPTGGATGTFSIAIKSATAATAVWLPTWQTRRRLLQVPRLPRGRASTPTRAQANPPFPFVQVKQPRRLRGLLARRGEAFAPVPAQVVVPPSAYPPQSVRARVRGLRLLRGHVATPPPAQLVPQLDAPRRSRGLRILFLRRGHAASPVPAQVAVTPPGYPPVGWRERARGMRLARGRAVTPVPTQVAPVAPTWVPRGVRARVRGALAKLRRFVAVPPAQAVPPPAVERRTVKPTARRGRRWSVVVPPQVVVPPPPYPPLAVHRHRRWLRRGARGADGWLVGASGHECETTRPDTGITPRPASGATVYSRAMTARPSTGTTARPDTGITEPPC